jgi:predicted amidophosphoribosyltransferase
MSSTRGPARPHRLAAARWVGGGVCAVVGPLVQAVAPRECVGCGVAPHDLCPSCAAPLRSGATRADPTPRPVGLPPAYAAAANDGAVRVAIVRLKESGRRGLRQPLGAALAAAVAVALITEASDVKLPVVLIPVPSSPNAVRARDTRAVADLATTAAVTLCRLGLAVSCWEGLRAVQQRADQTSLSAAGRAANLAGTLAARIPPDGVLVLIDDIITTGASLAESARAIRAVGGQVTACAVVAATQRWTSAQVANM